MNWHYLFLKWSAVVQLALGLQDAAMNRFEQILRTYPDDAYALSSRAHILAAQSDWRAALSDYDRLTATGLASASVWFNKGFVLEQMGRLEQALECFQKACDLDPQLDRAWYGLGLVLIQLRRSDEAIVALRHNTELQPMSPHGWYQLARVHMDRSEAEQAEKIMRHLQGFEPKVAAQLERETGIKLS